MTVIELRVVFSCVRGSPALHRAFIFNLEKTYDLVIEVNLI
jgi:hypothetical protein